MTWVGPSDSPDFGEQGIEVRAFAVARTRLVRPPQWIRAYCTAKQVCNCDVAGLIRSCDAVVAPGDTVLAPYRAQCKEVVIARNRAPARFAPHGLDRAGIDCLTVMHGKALMPASLDKRWTSALLKAVSLVKASGHHIRVIIFDDFEDDAGPDGLALRTDFLARIKTSRISDCLDFSRQHRDR